MELLFQEENYLVKTISAPEEFEMAWKLRHEVFSEELGWVPRLPNKMEVDTYDDTSEMIGVFTHQMELMGSLRIIQPPNSFMLDKEFACMMPRDKKIRRTSEVAEITRLCVKKEYRSSKYAPNVTSILYKGLYHWNQLKGVRYSAMVVDNRCFRILRLGCLPIEPFGDFITMPDGVKAAVCMLDWHEFEETAHAKRPEYYRWMVTLPDRYPSLSQSHGLYLQH